MKKLQKIISTLFVLFSLVVLFSIPFITKAQVGGPLPTHDQFQAAQQSFSAAAGDAVTQIGDLVTPSATSIWGQIQAEEGKYKFIVAFGPFSGPDNMTTDLTTGDALKNYLRTWFKFLIGVAGIIGVARLVMVGFKLIVKSDSINANKEIKGEIETIIISLLLVAGSWVFLNTINPSLVNSNLIIPKSTSTSGRLEVLNESAATPNEQLKAGITTPSFTYVITDDKTGQKRNKGSFPDAASCEAGIIEGRARASSSNQGVTISDKCYDHTNFFMTESELQIRTKLASNNIYANKSSCLSPELTHCTTLYGLGEPILNEIIQLANTCCGGQPTCSQGKIGDGKACPVLITGGTEAGHQTHGPNVPDVLDLNITGPLTNFLKSNATFITKSFCENTRYFYNGYWYTDEIQSGNPCKPTNRHFHVCAQNSSRTECKPVSQTTVNNPKTCEESDEHKGQIHCFGK